MRHNVLGAPRYIKAAFGAKSIQACAFASCLVAVDIGNFGAWGFISICLFTIF